MSVMLIFWFGVLVSAATCSGRAVVTVVVVAAAAVVAADAVVVAVVVLVAFVAVVVAAVVAADADADAGALKLFYIHLFCGRMYRSMFFFYLNMFIDKIGILI